uniref:Acetylornithine deacetylase (Acetylornithinase) (AO) (N-acetylornithinase) (NAO) n=1 Tax=mine drainage metagenome TaxID=410659 RepID=E6PZ32_9ZZZZ
MEQLLKALPELRVKAAIVSEPTSLRPGVAGKGYGLARVTVEGREAHSAFPQQGVSAIYGAARLIVWLEREFAQDAVGSVTEDERPGLFDPPRTTWNIGTITGGSAKNIIPGECSFLVEWRPVPDDQAGAVAQRLKDLVADFEQTMPDVRVSIALLRDEAGFARSGQGALETRLAKLLDSAPMGISFGSEASRLASIADEVIVMGPGDMRTAHSDRECVAVAELEQWTAVLRKLLGAAS